MTLACLTKFHGPFLLLFAAKDLAFFGNTRMGYDRGQLLLVVGRVEGAVEGGFQPPARGPHATEQVVTTAVGPIREELRDEIALDRAELCDDAVEWDYGVYEGRETSEIRQEIPGWSVWTHDIVGGESVADVGVRADRVIAAALASEGDVALFGHAHQLRILTARWLGLDASRGSNFVLDTASLSILSFEREQRVVSRWNELCPVRDVP